MQASQGYWATSTKDLRKPTHIPTHWTWKGIVKNEIIKE